MWSSPWLEHLPARRAQFQCQHAAPGSSSQVSGVDQRRRRREPWPEEYAPRNSKLAQHIMQNTWADNVDLGCPGERRERRPEERRRAADRSHNGSPYADSPLGLLPISQVRYCMCLVFPLSSWLRNVLSLRSCCRSTSI